MGRDAGNLWREEAFSRGRRYRDGTLEIVAACGYNCFMSSVSIRDAKNHFTELVRRAENGERIVVTRNGKPVADITVHQKSGGINYEAGEAYLRSLGIEGPLFVISDDFDDPLPEDFLLQPLPEPPPRNIG
jgi:antitoxin (DNA-binding transcriptional repressor) of toxin-antitoxin stability system